MKRIIFSTLMIVSIVLSSFSQSMLCTYKGGYFIRNGNNWYEYRPHDKDGVWAKYTQSGGDDNFYFIKNSQATLSIPKEVQNEIYIFKNNKWEVIYSVIGIYNYCPVLSSNIFAYDKGYFIKQGNKWQEYDPTQKRTGALDNFTQYSEDDDYYCIYNQRITLAIPRKGDRAFFMNNNGWVKLYDISALYDRYSPEAQSGCNSSKNYASGGSKQNNQVAYNNSNVSNNNAQSSNTQQNNNKVKIETDCINCFNGTCRMCNGVGGKNMFGTFVTCSGCLGSGKCSMCGGTHKIVRYYDKNVSTSNSNAGYSGVRSSGSFHNNNSNNSSKSRSNGKIICSDCHGSTICKSCGGKKGRWDYSWGDGNKHWFDCAICNGSGRCKLCRGMGYWY